MTNVKNRDSFFWSWMLGEVGYAERMMTAAANNAVDLPHARRTYVRAVFAGVEATISFAKGLLPGLHNATFTPAEMLFIEERGFKLKNGRIEDSEHRIRLLENLRHTLMLCAKTQNESPSDFKKQPDGTHPWQSVVDAYAIRNRLTHPKQESDLDISPQDVKTVQDAWKWLHTEIWRVLFKVS